MSNQRDRDLIDKWYARVSPKITRLVRAESLLERWLKFHTQSAGMTVETIMDKTAFAKKLADIEIEQAALIAETREVLALGKPDSAACNPLRRTEAMSTEREARTKVPSFDEWWATVGCKRNPFDIRGAYEAGVQWASAAKSTTSSAEVVLPELPEPTVNCGSPRFWQGWDAKQMESYARQAVEMNRGAEARDATLLACLFGSISFDGDTYWLSEIPIKGREHFQDEADIEPPSMEEFRAAIDKAMGGKEGE